MRGGLDRVGALVGGRRAGLRALGGRLVVVDEILAVRRGGRSAGGAGHQWLGGRVRDVQLALVQELVDVLELEILVDELVLLEVRILRRLHVVVHIVLNTFHLIHVDCTVVQHPHQRLQLVYVVLVLVYGGLQLLYSLLLVLVVLLLSQVHRDRLDLALELVDLDVQRLDRTGDPTAQILFLALRRIELLRGAETLLRVGLRFGFTL